MGELQQGTGLTQAISEAIGLLSKFFTPGVLEAGAMLGDWVRGKRFHNQVKLAKHAHEILRQEGLEPRPVSLRVLVPLLECGSLEEEQQMAERWASLFASAADPRSKTSAEASFVEILRQLAPSHAYLLDVFYAQITRYGLKPEEFSNKGAILSDLKSFLKTEVPDFDVASDNLLRLRLVAYPMVQWGVANGNAVTFQVLTSNILCATQLGAAFVNACGKGRTPPTMHYSVPSDSVANVYTIEGGSLQLWSREAEAAAAQYRNV